MPEMELDVADAAELAELPQFLSQWLARDPALERFVFLLGGSDGAAQLQGPLRNLTREPSRGP
jgi:hypothetical protein